MQRNSDLVALCLLISVLHVSGNNEFELHQYLFNMSRYNPSVRPRRNTSDSVDLTITWTTAFILDLEEKQGIFKQAANIQVEWSDDFLTWRPSLYGGISSVIVSGSDVWTPKIGIVNSGDTEFLRQGFINDVVRITSNGVVTALHSGTLDVVCSVDAQKFPFDSQECMVVLQTMAYRDREVSVAFSREGARTIKYIGPGHPLWKLVGMTTEIHRSFPGNLAVIYYVLKRKPLYYTCTIISPSLLLSVLTLGAYFVPNDSGEKVSCGLAIFLSFVVFLIQIGDVIPENSNGISVIVAHYTLCMVGSAVFILHAITQTFLNKYSCSACRPKRPRKSPESPEHSIDNRRFQVSVFDEKLDHSDDDYKDGSIQSEEFTITQTCSYITVSDALCFLLSLAFNIAGYSLLLDVYFNSI